MGTQRIIGLVVGLCLVVGGIVYLRQSGTPGKSLHVYTWSNYFPDNIIQDFTQKTGIKVTLSYFSSNEEMLAKLKAGATGFDVIQPSDYMVRQMNAIGLLNELDHAKLPNLKHLDEYYTKMPYDSGNKLSVPFTWGTTGIAINTKKVKVPAEGVSWKLLTETPDPKHTSLLDDMREVFGAFLLVRGLDPNTRDAKALADAKSSISAVKDRVLMFSSEPKPLLLKGEINLAHMYSVDAVQAHIDNADIEYFIPKEGGTIWTDNLAVPKASNHKEEAHLFIDYFLDPDNAFKLITENHLATPNKTAKARLPEDVLKNENLYPGEETLKKMHFLQDLGDTLPVINQLWTELKS